jgi:hypothetical chaperone protein
MPSTLGLDFGTTNTVLAQVGSGGNASPIVFSIDNERVEALRSALCFWQASNNAPDNLRIEAGPYAIQQFIDHTGECRFIQSFKTFAASPHFEGTYVYGKRYRFEDLLAAFLVRIRNYAGLQLDVLPKRLVVGRPVIRGSPARRRPCFAALRDGLAPLRFQRNHLCLRTGGRGLLLRTKP